MFYARGIPYRAQVEININYKGMRLIHFFKADLICYDSIIIELKACKSLEQIHRAQLLNYLKATNMHVGMLVNFNAYPHVTIERMVLGPGKELPKDTGNMKEEYFTTEDTEEEGENKKGEYLTTKGHGRHGRG
ncbi:hypothetical protein MASR2M78_30370 [Treponema sp.]